MLTCPTCNSNALSIVTTVESKKQASGLLDTLQVLGSVGALFCGFVIVALVFNTGGDILQRIFSSGSVFDAIYGAEELGFSLLIFYLAAGIFKWCAIAFLLSTLMKLLLPYRVSSQEKCICHNCQSQWKYIPYPLPPNNG